MYVWENPSELAKQLIWHSQKGKDTSISHSLIDGLMQFLPTPHEHF